MSSVVISKYYKGFSVLTFLVSMVGPLMLVEGAIAEKLWIGFLINLQFHLVFQFLSRVPFGMYQYLGKENPGIMPFAMKALQLFSWVVIILSIVGFAGFLNVALMDYSKFLATMTFPAMFLGGYSSKIKLSEARRSISSEE